MNAILCKDEVPIYLLNQRPQFEAVFTTESIHGPRNKGVQQEWPYLPSSPKTQWGTACFSSLELWALLNYRSVSSKGPRFSRAHSTGPIKPVYSCRPSTLDSLCPETSRRLGPLRWACIYSHSPASICFLQGPD